MKNQQLLSGTSVKATTTFDYDYPGRRYMTTDAGGNETIVSYDSGGRVYRRQQADYHPTTSAKDVVVTTDFEFDDAGRMIMAFAPALALRPMWRLPVIYEAMLKEIASHLVSES